jgi:hypothetical protein
MKMKNFDNKKRLMFIKGEDFYFLTYNILIILKALKCISPEKKFRDYRKLSYLVDFVSDKKLIDILLLSKDKNRVAQDDREYLSRAFTNGEIRLNEVFKLLVSLEKRKIIVLDRDSGNNTINVSLNSSFNSINIFNDNLFEAENCNVEVLKKVSNKIAMAKLETVIDIFFKKYGVMTWDI